MCLQTFANDPFSIREAKQAIEDSGVVILKNAVPVAVIDRLRERMEPDTERLFARGTWGGAGKIRGHLQQVPPRSAPFVDPHIVSNPVVMELLRSVLGEGFFLSLYSANVNTPGSVAQQVHADAGHLWFNAGSGASKWPLFHPATTLVVNVPLTDVDEVNGSTELYLGSHKDTEFEQWVPESQLHRYPRYRANSTKGDVVIRDIRTWHRGMPNHATRHRHMLAMIVNVWWLQRGQRNRFHVSARAAFSTPWFDANAVYVERDLDGCDQQTAMFQVPYLFEGRHVHQRATGSRASSRVASARSTQRTKVA
jgi:hypothetical protein